MVQVFPRSSNNLSRYSIAGAFIILAFVLWISVEFYNSSYVTEVSIAPEQPIPFSHKHHVSDDGLDCRYCHTTVEISAFAGIPSTETCMTCHSELFKTSPILEPLRVSFQTNQSISWQRVNRVPEFVFFNHSIHIHKGIGCSSCHGEVHTMPLTWRASTLRMEWCLSCHRAPQKHIRPRDQVFNMKWTPPPDQFQAGTRLVKEYAVATTRITDCYTCHR